MRSIFRLQALVLALVAIAGTNAQAQALIGCFKDQGDPAGTSGRDLSGFTYDSGSMTPALCIESCRGGDFAYAGVQYGRTCFCGNQYGSSGPASNCDMPCSGDSGQICGGGWANSVYSVANSPVVSNPIAPTNFSAPVVGDQERDFGDGKHGSVHAVLDPSGRMNVTTKTWSNSLFAGFTMGVKVMVLDEYQRVLAETVGGPGPYGVDGRMVPFGSASDRTDVLNVDFDAASIAKAKSLKIFIFHAPKWRIEEIVKQTGERLASLKQAVDDFCKKNADVCQMVMAQVG